MARPSAWQARDIPELYYECPERFCHVGETKNILIQGVRDFSRGKAGRCKLVWLSAIPSLLCRSVYIYPYTYVSDGARRCCTSRIDPAGRRAESVALRSQISFSLLDQGAD